MRSPSPVPSTPKNVKRTVLAHHSFRVNDHVTRVGPQSNCVIENVIEQCEFDHRDLHIVGVILCNPGRRRGTRFD